MTIEKPPSTVERAYASTSPRARAMRKSSSGFPAFASEASQSGGGDQQRGVAHVEPSLPGRRPGAEGGGIKRKGIVTGRATDKAILKGSGPGPSALLTHLHLGSQSRLVMDRPVE